DGVDHEFTGVTRKIAYDTIHSILTAGGLVLLSPLGFSPTGEAFNLTMEDVAVAAATALHADKLIFVTETPPPPDEEGHDLRELTAAQADRLLAKKSLPPEVAFYLRHCVKASRGGVPRVHMVPFEVDGATLLEIFTHDGV